MAGKNLPGCRKFRRIIVATENADDLLKLCDTLLLHPLIGPNARKADGCPQPEHARLLLLCRSDGHFELTYSNVEIRWIHPQQTFRA